MRRAQPGPAGKALGPGSTRVPHLTRIAAWVVFSAFLTGCTSWSEYVRNGFKVGPNYGRPAAEVADQWLDANDPNVKTDPAQDAAWWQTFRDPVLNSLVRTAYEQNLTLRVAGLRILEARAQRGIAVGGLFPQSQDAFGEYTRTNLSANAPSVPPNLYYDEWQLGANLAWELDFWGRFRRSIESADALLDAAVEDYDDVLVLLVAEVAQRYAELRTAEQRLRYAAQNVVIQRGSLFIAEVRYDNGRGIVPRLDVTQAQANLSQTQATIPPLEAARRQAANQICILLGVPPGNLDAMLADPEIGKAMEDMRVVLEKPDIQAIKVIQGKRVGKVIPTAPPQVAVGIPAELLRRRPDVRRAEREVAAQSALIGVAVSDLYPHISITGSLYFDAANFSNLFDGDSLAGNVGPSFRWNLLNYNRLRNNIRVQDARFQQRAVEYQNTVLRANAESENALVGFLKAQQQVSYLQKCTDASRDSLGLVQEQYDAGKTDFNRVFNVQQLLTQQEDQLAVAEGSVASNLISLYKSLGGGWQIRLGGPESGPATVAPQGDENAPAPAPAAPALPPLPPPAARP